MTDEEKKAIEYWKTHMEILHWNTQLASEHYIKVLLDLIEKQSKEIEELKETLKCTQNSWYEDTKIIDKIKAKIEPKLKELDEQINEEWKKYGNSKELQDMEDMYNFLQSLLRKEFPVTITKEELEKRWKE